MSEVDDVIKEFLIESYENLDRMDQDLVDLEEDPDNRNTIGSIFRTIHTLKGTSGFFGFSKLESITHVGESLLSQLRDGAQANSPEITSALLALNDAVRGILTEVETTAGEGDGDYSSLIDTLTALNTAGSSHADGHGGADGVATASKPAADGSKTDAGAVVTAPATPFRDIGQILVAENKVSSKAVEDAAIAQLKGDTRRLGEILVDSGVVKHEDVLDALRKQGAPPPAVAAKADPDKNAGDKKKVADSSIRVDVGLLDKLMNLVGELVLARNQVLQFTSTLSADDAVFHSTSQRLNLVTTELQEGVMKTRMQPIGNVWSKLPRVVRDLALACGKKIRLEMQGNDTELDRTIIEAIKDPLVHIVRNSADHGIEPPEDRIALGKQEEGCIRLSAFHEGGQVNIEISDDGRGLDAVRIKEKALSKGLINPEQAARLSERELPNLIFLPGFSTAQTVTNISGRGVGMDVVKSNIEKIGGSVDVQSRLNGGTTLKIKIPLTLAIIPGLIVVHRGDRYAIPQVGLLELVRLEGDDAHKGIERIHGCPVYRLRGNLLPIVYLSDVLGYGEETVDPAATNDNPVNIVVLQANGHPFGLVVERIHDTEEIVVKPLGKQLKSITAFAGATIMGDGRVALILDVMGIAQMSNVVSGRRDRGIKDPPDAQPAGHSITTLLVFSLGGEERMALPLALVKRLEEVPRANVEIGGGDVIQYRGEIMPLIRLRELIPERTTSHHLATPDEPEDAEDPDDAEDDVVQRDDTMHVIVYSEQDRSVGLVVERILDIIEDEVTVRRPASREGILESLVVQDRVTEMLDVRWAIAKALPDFFAAEVERVGVMQ